MGADQKPRPLTSLYEHASELLAKARRDRGELRAAADEMNYVRLRDAVFNFSVTAHHLRECIISLHPNLKSEVNSFFGNNDALKDCRDICNSSKHFELDLKKGGYPKYPPSVKKLEQSATAPVSAELTAEWHLKVVRFTGERIRVEDLADEAISALDGFFKKHGL